MSLKELEDEYQISLKEKNQRLQSTILSSILDKQIDDDKKRLQYFMNKIDLLIEMGAYSDAYQLIQVYFQQRPNYHRTDTDDLRFEIQCGQIIMLKGDVWNGYLIVLKAFSQTYKFKIYLKPNNIPKHKQPNDEQLEQMKKNIQKIDQINDWAKQFIILLNKGMDFTVVEGQQEQYCGVGKRINSVPITAQPELKNRIVKQIACGTNHVLVLTECITSHQTYFLKTNTDLNYDHLIQPECNVVFGWGDNSNGQVLGDPNLVGPLIHYPTIVSQLKDKKIQGIYAKDRLSGAFDDEGIIYEWGSEGDPCLQIEPNGFQKITGSKLQSIKKGENFTSIQNQQKELFVWGRINSILTRDIVFHSLKIPKKLETPENIKIVQHFTGDNHIIIIDQHNKIWGYGDNSKYQLGPNTKSKNAFCMESFQQIEDEYLQENEIVTKCVLGHTSTFYLCQSGNVYFTGYVSDNLQSKEPRKIMFNEGIVKVRDLYIYDSDILVISTLGIAYSCYSKFESIFSCLNTTYGQKFSFCYFTKYCRIFQRSPLKLPICKIAPIENLSFMSLEQININFNLFDQQDIPGYNLFYPYRIYYYIYPESKGHDLSKPELFNKAKLKFLEEYDNINENKFYVYELSDSQLIENAEIKTFKEEESKIDKISFSFKIKSQGKYNIFLWLNEYLMQEDPIQLAIKQSQEEKQREIQVKNMVKLTQKQIDDLEIEIFLASSQIQTKKDKIYELNKEKRLNNKKITGDKEMDEGQTIDILQFRNLEIDKEIDDLQQKIEVQQKELDILKDKLNNPQPNSINVSSQQSGSSNNGVNKYRSGNSNNSMNKSGNLQSPGMKSIVNKNDYNQSTRKRRKTQEQISEFEYDSQNTSMNRSRNLNRSNISQKRKTSQPVSSSGRKSSIIMLKESLLNSQKMIMDEIEDELKSDFLLQSINSVASKGSSYRGQVEIQNDKKSIQSYKKSQISEQDSKDLNISIDQRHDIDMDSDEMKSPYSACSDLPVQKQNNRNQRKRQILVEKVAKFSNYIQTPKSKLKQQQQKYFVQKGRMESIQEHLQTEQSEFNPENEDFSPSPNKYIQKYQQFQKVTKKRKGSHHNFVQFKELYDQNLCSYCRDIEQNEIYLNQINNKNILQQSEQLIQSQEEIEQEEDENEKVKELSESQINLNKEIQRQKEIYDQKEKERKKKEQEYIEKIKQQERQKLDEQLLKEQQEKEEMEKRRLDLIEKKRLYEQEQEEKKRQQEEQRIKDEIELQNRLKLEEQQRIENEIQQKQELERKQKEEQQRLEQEKRQREYKIKKEQQRQKILKEQQEMIERQKQQELIRQEYELKQEEQYRKNQEKLRLEKQKQKDEQQQKIIQLEQKLLEKEESLRKEREQKNQLQKKLEEEQKKAQISEQNYQSERKKSLLSKKLTESLDNIEDINSGSIIENNQYINQNSQTANKLEQLEEEQIYFSDKQQQKKRNKSQQCYDQNQNQNQNQSQQQKQNQEQNQQLSQIYQNSQGSIQQSIQNVNSSNNRIFGKKNNSALYSKPSKLTSFQIQQEKKQLALNERYKKKEIKIQKKKQFVDQQTIFTKYLSPMRKQFIVQSYGGSLPSKKYQVPVFEQNGGSITKQQYQNILNRQNYNFKSQEYPNTNDFNLEGSNNISKDSQQQKQYFTSNKEINIKAASITTRNQQGNGENYFLSNKNQNLNQTSPAKNNDQKMKIIADQLEEEEQKQLLQHNLNVNNEYQQNDIQNTNMDCVSDNYINQYQQMNKFQLGSTSRTTQIQPIHVQAANFQKIQFVTDKSLQRLFSVKSYDQGSNFQTSINDIDQQILQQQIIQNSENSKIYQQQEQEGQNNFKTENPPQNKKKTQISFKRNHQLKPLQNNNIIINSTGQDPNYQKIDENNNNEENIQQSQNNSVYTSMQTTKNNKLNNQKLLLKSQLSNSNSNKQQLSDKQLMLQSAYSQNLNPTNMDSPNCPNNQNLGNKNIVSQIKELNMKKYEHWKKLTDKQKLSLQQQQIQQQQQQLENNKTQNSVKRQYSQSNLLNQDEKNSFQKYKNMQNIQVSYKSYQKGQKNDNLQLNNNISPLRKNTPMYNTTSSLSKLPSLPSNSKNKDILQQQLYQQYQENALKRNITLNNSTDRTGSQQVNSQTNL